MSLFINEITASDAGPDIIRPHLLNIEHKSISTANLSLY